MDQEQFLKRQALDQISMHPEYLQYLNGEKCWFCSNDTAEKKYVMFGKSSHLVSSDVLSTTTREKKFLVPRCSVCAAIHNKLLWVKRWFLLTVLVLWWLPLIVWSDYDEKWWISIIITLIGIVGCLIFRLHLVRQHPEQIDYKAKASKYETIAGLGKALS